MDRETLTVMIVDDYEEIHPTLRLWLESFGCRVIEAFSGREAIEMTEREKPDLILMDLFMPEMDGMITTLRMRKDEALSAIPIIAMSAYEEGKAIQLQIDPTAVGFNAYLPKPFTPEELAAVLERYLPRRSLAAGAGL